MGKNPPNFQVPKYTDERQKTEKNASWKLWTEFWNQQQKYSENGSEEGRRKDAWQTAKSSSLDPEKPSAHEPLPSP